ncbi:MAG: hypothetical protein OEV78_08920 [Spirochaetia bacterium]|nr:hypothetical protein [Spirochaetia bacterium]
MNNLKIHNFIKLFLWVFCFNLDVYPQELWNDVTETMPQNGYQKKVINLALQENYINVQPSKEEKSLPVLVVFTHRDPGDWYHKTLVNKFYPNISVLNYKMKYNIGDGMYSDQASFEKASVKHYLKNGVLFNSWPSVYPETAEIKKELEQNNYEQKFLLLTGNQSQVLIHTGILKNFDRIILVSPNESLDSMKNDLWQNKQVLWVGSKYEQRKLESLQVKFGGKILTYERSLTGKNLLLRNDQVLSDILTWINS